MTATETTGPAVSAGPAPARGTKRRNRARAGQRREIALFVTPAVLVYVVFVLLPVVLAAYYSFFNWNGLGPVDRFIGLDNYVRLLTDPVFHTSVYNNFFIIVLSLLIQGPIAILVALLMNRRLRFRGLLRALIFVPYVLSEVTAGLAWQILLQSVPPTRWGPVDTMLQAIGIQDPPAWLADPNVVMWTMFGILTWKYLGLAIILMLAGLAGVPEELYEAAALDGAGWWKTQWYITVPLLGPTIRIWAFLSIIGSLQLFDMVWVTVAPTVRSMATETMATYMVQQGQFAGQPGYGSAIAVILFFISLIVALLYQRFALRRDLAGAITRGVR